MKFSGGSSLSPLQPSFSTTSQACSNVISPVVTVKICPGHIFARSPADIDGTYVYVQMSSRESPRIAAIPSQVDAGMPLHRQNEV